jgi:hypothetical protein
MHDLLAIKSSWRAPILEVVDVLSDTESSVLIVRMMH